MTKRKELPCENNDFEISYDDVEIGNDNDDTNHIVDKADIMEEEEGVAEDAEEADQRKSVTYEEMWDDRELVKMWNSTIRKYKRYHKSHGKPTADELEESMKKPLPQWKVSESVENETCDSLKQNEPYSTGFSQALATATQEMTEQELMEKLSMAWYNVGFYTGLYYAKR